MSGTIGEIVAWLRDPKIKNPMRKTWRVGNHKNSKCQFFHQGMILNWTCDKVIAHCFCDLDEMEEDKPCTADACYYYTRREEGVGDVIQSAS